MTVKKTAHIIGEVQYRAGDGVDVTIPPGPCEVEPTSQDVTISWQEGNASQVTAIPFDLYTTYLTEGRIVVDTTPGE